MAKETVTIWSQGPCSRFAPCSRLALECVVLDEVPVQPLLPHQLRVGAHLKHSVSGTVNSGTVVTGVGVTGYFTNGQETKLGRQGNQSHVVRRARQ